MRNKQGREGRLGYPANGIAYCMYSILKGKLDIIYYLLFDVILICDD
jgi:hypothetical protein